MTSQLNILNRSASTAEPNQAAQGSVYRPAQFFLITFLITWVSWFIAAYFSYQPGQELYQLLFMLPGLFGPFIAALSLTLVSGDKALQKDFWDRLWNLKRIRPIFLPISLLLMPVVLVVATLLSLLFGQSLEQFKFASQFSFSAAFFPVVLILILAPTLEELGWRGYGMDSLRARYGLLPATLLFAVFWALWHLPLYFVNHYYQNELWTTNPIYAFNFMVSVFPAAILMTWVYYRNNRSIVACILFHFMLDLSSEIFQTTQFTKCIITVILIAVSVGVIWGDKELFWGDQKTAAK